MHFFDIFQQFQIQQNKKKTEDLEDEARERRYTNRTIDERISKLALVSNAVWSFVKEAQHLDDMDLISRIEEIDCQDGVKDGKASTVVTTCLGCGRKNNTRHKTCLYCGAQNHKYSPFSEVS